MSSFASYTRLLVSVLRIVKIMQDSVVTWTRRIAQRRDGARSPPQGLQMRADSAASETFGEREVFPAKADSIMYDAICTTTKRTRIRVAS